MDRFTAAETQRAWPPLRGSWEEAVLTWHEQVEATFRRRLTHSLGPVPGGQAARPVLTMAGGAVSSGRH